LEKKFQNYGKNVSIATCQSSQDLWKNTEKQKLIENAFMIDFLTPDHIGQNLQTVRGDFDATPNNFPFARSYTEPL